MPDILTPPTLNKIPQGLLGFLGIKSGGRYPDSLGSQLVPVADLLLWYANTNREYVRTGINVAALAQTTFFTVPNGEYWYVQNASFVTSALTAGQTFAGKICSTDAAGLRTLIWSDDVPARTAGEVFATHTDGFFLQPGDTLGIYTTQLAAGPIVTPILAVAFSRLPV